MACVIISEHAHYEALVVENALALVGIVVERIPPISSVSAAASKRGQMCQTMSSSERPKSAPNTLSRDTTLRWQ